MTPKSHVMFHEIFAHYMLLAPTRHKKSPGISRKILARSVGYGRLSRRQFAMRDQLLLWLERPLPGGGGIFIGKWYGMCCSQDSCFTGQSTFPILPIYHQCAAHAPHPHFQFSEEHFAHSALFWSKFELSRCKFCHFLFPRPLIFQGKSSL